jgi:uncharacterized protein YjlB
MFCQTHRYAHTVLPLPVTSSTHEVLVIFRGFTTLLLGGTHALDVRAGDVLLIPAGVAHRSLPGRKTADFCMVGAYPRASVQWDMLTSAEPGARERITSLGNGGIHSDPIYGSQADAPIPLAWGLEI